MSTMCVGVSTSSFIRSTRLVPPAMKRVRGLMATSRVASAASVAAEYSKGRMSGSPRGAYVLDGGDDARIGTAPAEVSAHALLHVGVGRAARLLEQRGGRHELARRAVPALEPVVLDERRLHRVQRVGAREPLHRRDLVALMHHGEREAGEVAAPVHVHRARAALAMVAP